MIILEQNVLPGVVNRLCAKLGGKVFLSFSESLQYLSGEVVGNPVRQEIYNADRLTARRELGFSPEDKVVLIMGGSQGARTINKTVLAAIPDLPVGVKVVHLIGQRDFAAINAQLAGKNYSNYFPKSYVHEMANLLAAADLVVSRAGATAISEFLARSLPMILIPFPFAAADHQRLNAAAVVAAGRAKTISDADFTPASFIGLLGELVDNYAKIDQPRAAKRIVDYFYA